MAYIFADTPRAPASRHLIPRNSPMRLTICVGELQGEGKVGGGERESRISISLFRCECVSCRPRRVSHFPGISLSSRRRNVVINVVASQSSSELVADESERDRLLAVFRAGDRPSRPGTQFIATSHAIVRDRAVCAV